MPFLLSQNKKILIAVLTTVLMIFSTVMLFFGGVEDVSLKAKASVLHGAQEKEVHATQ